jgi:cell division protein FtsZ
VLRTGTDNLPLLTQPVAAAGALAAPSAAPALGAGMGAGLAASLGGGGDYAGLATPSVWRTGRTQAAAKVEALSSNGMDEIEIPAFLRKQAD